MTEEKLITKEELIQTLKKEGVKFPHKTKGRLENLRSKGVIGSAKTIYTADGPQGFYPVSAVKAILNEWQTVGWSIKGDTTPHTSTQITPKRGPGRPKGSVNKVASPPKTIAPASVPSTQVFAKVCLKIMEELKTIPVSQRVDLLKIVSQFCEMESA